MRATTCEEHLQQAQAIIDVVNDLWHYAGRSKDDDVQIRDLSDATYFALNAARDARDRALNAHIREKAK